MFGVFRRTKIRTPYGYGARAPLPPIPPPQAPLDERIGVYMRQCGITMQQEKERMKMPEEVTYTNHNRVIGVEIDRLQKLLATPNLDEETIKQANENLRRLLVEQRMPHATRTGEVWLDGK